MADAPLNGLLSQGVSYTVPAGKMAAVRLYGVASSGQRTSLMYAGAVAGAVSIQTDFNGGLDVAGELKAIVQAGGVLSVAGSGASASYSGILRDV